MARNPESLPLSSSSWLSGNPQMASVPCHSQLCHDGVCTAPLIVVDPDADVAEFCSP